jgi:CheY-like chemotaxis protein
MDTGQIKHRLLIVDGDPKKAGFEVVTASQSSEALAALQAALPDLIISDTDLDGTDGFDLCRQIKARTEWAKIPILFVSGRKSIEDKIRGLELGVEDYLTKPIYIKEIAIRVRTALQRAERERLESRREGRTKFAGDLEDIGVVDLVQTIDLNRKSGIIHIVNRDGRRGAVFFREGRVIDAEVGRLSGAEAMFRLFSWSEGRFEVEFKPIRRRDVINLPSAALLMEGMHRLDEWTRILESLPPLHCVVEVDYKVLADQLADLPDEMNSLLRLCDGSRTLLAVMDDCDFPDLEALTLASKLFSERIIFARETAGRESEPEPVGELARWLAEGNAEDGVTTEERRTAQHSSTEVESHALKDLSAEEPQDEEIQTSGERKPAKTLKTFSLQQPTPSPDISSPEPQLLAAPDEWEKAPQTGNTLKLIAATPEQRYPHPQVAIQSDQATEPFSPIAGSAVVEESWREPTELPVGSSTPSVETTNEAAEEGAKADTLRGIPIAQEAPRPDKAESAPNPEVGEPSAQVGNLQPEQPLDSDQEHTTQVAVALAESRTARTTIEYGPEKREPQASAGAETGPPTEAASKAARETDWSAWSQGAESKPTEATAPVAESGSEENEPQAEPAAVQERTPSDGESPKPDARVPEQAPQAKPAKPAAIPTISKLAPASNSAKRLQSTGPTSEEMYSAFIPHERRWFVPAAVLAMLVVGGWLALRSSSPDIESQVSTEGETSLATATSTSASSLSDASQAEADQPVDSLPMAGSTEVLVAGGAAPTDAQPIHTGEGPSGKAMATGELPSRAVESGQGQPAATADTGVAANEEILERCRKANAGGRGRASAVLAACRPAVEAEPKTGEAMVYLARAELDRGRVVEARIWAKKALEINPALADAYIFLGGAEQEMGNSDEAKTAYKKYLELAPSGRHARELRAVLDSL